MKIVAGESAITALQSEISTHALEIDGVQAINQLIWASDKAFVSAVTGALRELGLVVVEGPHPRADILIFDGKRVGAIEAEGLEGCARETNLRQTEAWVTDVKSAFAFMAEKRTDNADMKRNADLLQGMVFKSTVKAKRRCAKGSW